MTAATSTASGDTEGNTSAGLQAAATALSQADAVVHSGFAHLGAAGADALDTHQAVAYDLAHAAAGLASARVMLDYGLGGAVEARLANAFAADTLWDVSTRLLGRESAWGAAPTALDATRSFVSAHRDPRWLAALASQSGPRHLDGDFEMVADTFRRFANERIAPVAEHIHRSNSDIPEDIISGLGELGAFGLSIPEAYGGYATGAESDYLGMVIATEELSRASLGAGGSLITRPEILARALVRGGTEDQKQRWLPRLATGEIMVAVAVTEPDFGSDVANLTTAALLCHDGTGDWVISGTKTWSTFAARADVLMLLARTDPDRSAAHRGLSLFVLDKERADGHGFVLSQPGGGRLEGRPIDTIGYRGMHSYELAFDGWRVPGDRLIGGEGGLGRGFYYQMEGFENGRLQTAARAVGVMQAAYEAARAYAADRRVFGRPVGDYQLSQVKLARMAVLIQAGRQTMYHVARLMARGEGALEASMVKAFVCRAAEWVTREALQLHGGMGYAEEYPVSRFFVDARVLSIFEGADETLALKVIARRLLASALP
ncbi:MAG: acyl-CoA dehydrogenase family protein [Actinomycetota bacterium]|nr:acyl-CoA dehydrogenase family protein [Actinomycetota bacterium]